MRAGGALSSSASTVAKVPTSRTSPEDAVLSVAADTGVAEQVPAGTMFTCLLKSQIREGFDMSSAKCDILAKGALVAPLEIRRNTAGIRRVRFSKGWVSELTSDGRVVLGLDDAKDSAPSPSARSPPGRSPPSAPDVEEVPPGTMFICLLKSQIRNGFEMDSEKGGILKKGTIVQALEVRRNVKGTRRVRFDLGWVSETTSDGRLVLQLSPPNADVAATAAVAGNEPAEGAAAAAAAAGAGAAVVNAEIKQQTAAAVAVERRGQQQQQQQQQQVVADKAVADEQAVRETATAEAAATAAQAASVAADNTAAGETLKEQGLRCFERHQFEESISALERAAKEEPGDEEIREALDFARITFERQRDAEIERQISKISEVAMQHFSSKRFDECVSVLEQAIAIQPTNQEVQEALSFAKRLRGASCEAFE